MPLLLLVALFIAVPIAELYVIVWVVGEAIGAPLTVLILVADSLLGSLLLRSQGRAAWMRFSTALSQGRVPHREVVDGGLIIFGGALLITPGFLTDVLGLLLLLPPTRAVARRLVARVVAGRVVVGVAGASGRRAGSRGPWGRRRRDPSSSAHPYDVEGTATPHEPADVEGPPNPHEPATRYEPSRPSLER